MIEEKRKMSVLEKVMWTSFVFGAVLSLLGLIMEFLEGWTDDRDPAEWVLGFGLILVGIPAVFLLGAGVFHIIKGIWAK